MDVCRYSAVGFDIGETLIFNKQVGLNWREHYASALLRAFQNVGIKPSEPQLSLAASIMLEYNTRIYPRTTEVSSDRIFRRIVDETGLPGTSNIELLAQGYFSYFEDESVAFYSDALGCLRRLKAMGLRIGYLTDVAYGQTKAYTGRMQLIREELESISSVYLTSVDVGYRKPEAIGFHKLASALGTKCSETAYVGNEEKDMVGAKSAGMTAILVDREQTGHVWGQDYTIYSLNDLVTIL